MGLTHVYVQHSIIYVYWLQLSPGFPAGAYEVRNNYASQPSAEFEYIHVYFNVKKLETLSGVVWSTYGTAQIEAHCWDSDSKTSHSYDDMHVKGFYLAATLDLSLNFMFLLNEKEGNKLLAM